MKAVRFDSLRTAPAARPGNASTAAARFRWGYGCISAVGLCLLAAVASAGETAGNRTSTDGLTEALAQARQEIAPIRASDVSAAKQRLIEAVDRLQARLDRDKGQGDNWRKYLRLDELAAELKK
ncbi:MAG: hypothetical protein GYA33_01870, partial [Thermogutta sp.]|nr:hypothetical protein [Thermogutta sp.]